MRTLLRLVSLSLAVLAVPPAFALVAMPEPIPVACTMDAKLCPDGVTYVGRDGYNNCEWEPCPTEKPARPSFSDVPYNHANADAIAYVKSEGIVEGYADGTFRPDETINRAEFVKILMGAVEDDGRMCKIAPFSDIPYDAWYAQYAHQARCNGIVQGYPDGTFRPSNNINFVETAKILVTAFDPPSRYELHESSRVPPWYEYPVIALEENKAIPMSITSFDQAITRGEMAEMIYRLMAGDRSKPSKTYEELQEVPMLVYYEPNRVYSITYPKAWRGSEQEDGSYWISITLPQNDYVHSAYIQITTPQTCPTVPTRTVGIVQTVTLGGHSFTAYEMIDGAAGTSYDTITFFSQVQPTRCIVIDKAIGTLNADPMNDMGDYTPEHAVIRDAEQKEAQDVMGNAIKSIVIY